MNLSRAHRVLAAFLALAGLAACAPEPRPIDRQQVAEANMQADMTTLKSRTQEMRMRLEEIESRVGKQGRGVTLEDVNQRLAQLETAVQRIAATLGIDAGIRPGPSAAPTAAATQPSYPEAAPASRQPDTYGGAPVMSESPPAGPISMGPDSTDPAEAIYNMGMEAYNTRDYERANTLFAELVKSYPSSRQAPDALFWQAESNYQLGDYGRAALLCQDVISKYPRHPIVPSAMLKQAMSFRRLGKAKAASILLQDVVKHYPGSPEARSAQALLREP